MPILEDLGLRHAAYGIRPADFDAVGAALLDALGELDPARDPRADRRGLAGGWSRRAGSWSPRARRGPTPLRPGPGRAIRGRSGGGAMGLSWVRERTAVWDAGKVRLVGEAPAGVFDARYRELPAGAPVPGEWWRVEDEGQVVGYGWLEVVWGDGEVLFVVAPEARGRGVGGSALERLCEDARARGLRYLYNTVRATHPERERLTAWLTKRGFKPAEDGS
ncbi:MAG: GNAT family N-acetyltransferase, partial [Planctomycetota bacterium]|nr:GNAT family N-acetyltransferase [Planctomycetota bacterium]